MKHTMIKQSSLISILLLCFAMFLFFPDRADAASPAQTISGEAIQAQAVSGNAIQGQAVSGEAIQTQTVSGEAIQTQTVSGEAIQTQTVSGEGVQVMPVSGDGIQVQPGIDTPSSLGTDVSGSAVIASISQEKLVLTEGFSKRLRIVSSSGLIRWSSDHKKIASVDANGKVTGKKIGSCTITAMCDEGTFTCKVTVKKNSYRETRITIGKVHKNTVCVQVYKADYGNKGTMKVTLAIANRNQHKIESLKKMKVTFKTANGKKIASYTLKNKIITIKKREIKNVSFEIPKKNVVLKKADLRNAFSTVSGTYGYTKTTLFQKEKNKTKDKNKKTTKKKSFHN